MNKAKKFALAYDKEFKKNTSKLSHAEIPLFRAMHQTLVNLSSSFDIEEYHGSGHQVKFMGNGSYARNDARCELSDLMIVIYSPQSRDIRLTFLQAKSERKSVASVYNHKFSANLEQWYLLDKRPAIKGWGKFNPPNDLLSSAHLPSIGSFAFFYKNNNTRQFETCYASANSLAPYRPKSSRKGRLQLNATCSLNYNNGYLECNAACSNVCFAYNLYSSRIGAPIVNNKAIKKWLAGVITARIEDSKVHVDDGKESVAEQLLKFLDVDGAIKKEQSFGAKSLFLLKCVE